MMYFHYSSKNLDWIIFFWYCKRKSYCIEIMEAKGIHYLYIPINYLNDLILWDLENISGFVARYKNACFVSLWEFTTKVLILILFLPLISDFYPKIELTLVAWALVKLNLILTCPIAKLILILTCLLVEINMILNIFVLKFSFSNLNFEIFVQIWNTLSYVWDALASMISI